MKYVDDSRRSLEFSTDVIRHFNNKSVELFIEWMLESIGGALNIKRVAYGRVKITEDKKRQFVMVSGIGPYLPLTGSEIKIPEIYTDSLTINGFAFIPTENVGWDAAVTFETEYDSPGVILLDDIHDQRDFDAADRDFLKASAKWFAAFLQTKKEADSNQKRAETDALTDLPNRRACESKIKNLAKKMRADHSIVGSVCMIDIDKFKLINDTYGHPMGDQILKTLAMVMKRNVSERVFVGRYGGEEFMVISDDSPDGVYKTVNNILSDFREIEFTTNNGHAPFHSSFSAGLFSASIKSENLVDTEEIENVMYEKADSLLYEAKDQGRNRIIMR